MLTINTRFVTVGKQDLFFLSSLFKKLPYNVITQPCSTAVVDAPKINDQKENLGTSNLPLLPVQPLDQMLVKYLKSVKPFVNPLEFENTRQLVDDFCNNENSGKKLQILLQNRAKKTENWLSDWWLDVAYLKYRNPVVIYSSPALVWPKTYFLNERHQLSYAAHLIKSALNFNLKIEKNEIEHETVGNKYKLCMSQYKKIFGTCRIPKIPKDELMFQDPDNPSNNIIVMYNNHLFSIPAFENMSRRPFSPETYFTWLLSIVEMGKESSAPGVGLLTSESRDKWAKSYEQLKQIPKNKELLEKYIEKALFVICIDKPLIQGDDLSYDNRCSKLLLHGFGSKGNGGNRWYDKTIQFVVGANDDGRGIIYEHSPAEGGPIGVLTNHVIAEVNPKSESVLYLSQKNMFPIFASVKKLEFILSDSLLKDIELAGNAINKLSDNLQVNTWLFTRFGKNKLKSFRVSPDSFIQIAIQLAFFNLHNHPGAQYESGSLRKYLYGRTDVIRTCSEEVVNFCRIMREPEQNDKTKLVALDVALKAHKAYVLSVINGCGVDRHLLALRLIAEMNNMEEPKIFSDVAYQKSTHFYLSTSNVPADCNAVMVYGPLVKDGYACCYNPRNQYINFGMSAWADCESTDLNQFKQGVEKALNDMMELLYANSVVSKL